MSNLIIVGDSFCASANGWPSLLAKHLNLQLISHGQGGQPWWNARDFLINLSSKDINASEYIIFVHTNAERIPTLNTELGLIDHSNPESTELAQSIKLYYKYIHDHDFLNWSQQQWFLEITRQWGHKKICHLHSFPWSLKYNNLLSGLVVNTNLCSISLNELGAKEFTLIYDNRLNHLNDYNNQILSNQLAKLLKNYSPGHVTLDVSQYSLKTTHWFDWK